MFLKVVARLLILRRLGSWRKGVCSDTHLLWGRMRVPPPQAPIFELLVSSG